VSDKKNLSERDICTQFITPALQRAGWDFATQVREEFIFTKGLCDRLKAGIAESLARQERLAATLIEIALKAA
jgi:type I site-specific restriction endonuclease